MHDSLTKNVLFTLKKFSGSLYRFRWTYLWANSAETAAKCV